MGLTTLIVAALAVVCMIAYTEAGNCPLPSKVYSCSPKCTSDHDCSLTGKVCCQNSCNAKSCSVPAAGGTGTGGSNKYGGGGVGVYCDNVKCQPHEVCKMDSLTKRNKCGRA